MSVVVKKCESRPCPLSHTGKLAASEGLCMASSKNITTRLFEVFEKSWHNCPIHSSFLIEGQKPITKATEA